MSQLQQVFSSQTSRLFVARLDRHAVAEVTIGCNNHSGKSRLFQRSDQFDIFVLGASDNETINAALTDPSLDRTGVVGSTEPETGDHYARRASYEFIFDAAKQPRSPCAKDIPRYEAEEARAPQF